LVRPILPAALTKRCSNPALSNWKQGWGSRFQQISKHCRYRWNKNKRRANSFYKLSAL